MNKKISLMLSGMSLACFALAERPDNELPMYGGNHNPIVEENVEASRSAAKLGWKYFYKGDVDTAIKRFNQAWMFDRNSSSAYWGFGLIMGKRAEAEENSSEHLQESIKHLGKALALDEGNQRIMVDLGISHMGLGFFKQEHDAPGFKDQFAKADYLFTTAKDKEPEYPVLWINWAYLKYYQEEFSTAQKYLAQARALGLSPPPGFVNDLETAILKAHHHTSHFTVWLPDQWQVKLSSRDTNGWTYAFLDGTNQVFEAFVWQGTSFRKCFCAPWDKYSVSKRDHEEIRTFRLGDCDRTFKIAGESYSLDIHASCKGYDKRQIDRILASIRMKRGNSESPEPKLSPEEQKPRREEIRRNLQDYQMEVVRKGMPPLPVPLTPEMDDQLVAEGILPPTE